MPKPRISSPTKNDADVNAERLRDFAEVGSDWFFEMDQELRLTFLSGNHQEITGIAAQEMIGKTPWEAHRSLIDPKYKEKWQDNFENIKAHNGWKNFTFTINRSDGEKRILQNSAKAIFDKSGAFSGYRGVGCDITNQVNSETRLNSMLEVIPDAIITIDESGTVNSFSNSAEEIFQYSASEIIGQNVNILMPEPHGSKHDGYLKRYHHTGEKRIIGIGRELEARRKDGTIFPINLSVNEMVVAGQKMFTGILHDLSELKDAQHLGTRVGKILDRSLNEIYLFDAETLAFVQVNYGARQNMGYNNDDFRQMTPVDIKPQYSKPQFSELIAPLREDREELLIFKTIHLRKDGTTYPVEIHLQLMRNETPQVFLAVVRDITEIERKEAQLRQSQKMEAIGQLTGGIAHDFNNLLTVIIGNNELLNDHLTDELQRGLLEDSTAAAEHAAQLTNQLLTFARQQPLEPQRVDLNELVEDLSEMLERTLGENIRIKTNLGSNLNSILVDPGQLHSAILNLAINARDAMPSGGDLIVETSNAHIDSDSVLNRSDAATGDYVRLSIRDTGTGMPPEIQSRVLDPFFTTKETGKGTGLGLSMVHGFTKQSGGFLEIYSELGYGTAISLYMPISNEQVSTLRDDSDATLPKVVEDKTILVVEDDPRVRSVTMKRLQYLGYKTIEADSGQKALEILEQNSAIDLVFTDMVMPRGMTGGELLDQVEKHYPTVKRLITSGYAEDGIIPNHGAKWLRKPYPIQEMTKVFEELLG